MAGLKKKNNSAKNANKINWPGRIKLTWQGYKPTIFFLWP